MTHHFVETITLLTTTVADNVSGTPWKGMWAIWRLLLAYCIAISLHYFQRFQSRDFAGINQIVLEKLPDLYCRLWRFPI